MSEIEMMIQERREKFSKYFTPESILAMDKQFAGWIANQLEKSGDEKYWGKGGLRCGKHEIPYVENEPQCWHCPECKK